jgi:ribosome maturation factor RimP
LLNFSSSKGHRSNSDGLRPIFYLRRMRQPEHALVERVVSGLGYEFVHLEWVPRSGLMRVYIDRDGGVNLDDCARVSEQLSRTLSVERVPYDRLEISSPGLDRPLARESDFRRFAGQRAKVSLRVPMNGRKNVTGVIMSNSPEGSVALSTGGTLFVIEFVNIDKARLVPEL